MKKGLIVTLYGDYNYGNKLQNYALQYTLEKFGTIVSTLDTSNNECTGKNIKELVKKLLKKIRINKFRNFSKTYLKLQNKDSNLKDFDFVCIGSDQIWNPNYCNDFYYSFAKFSQNVFSYAASFGIEKVPDKYVTDIRNGLEHLKHISVREDLGKKIVEQISNRQANVHLDPTMLLTSEEWDCIAQASAHNEKKKYILTYFLGNYSNERKEYIKKIAKENRLKIINLNQMLDYQYYSISPNDFLNYIKNSELVLTDSFHGAVFSIIYKKAFYIMEREEKSEKLISRIETLLNKFCLTDRTIKNYNQNLTFECDFSKTDEILRVEREKSLEYLKNALDIK